MAEIGIVHPDLSVRGGAEDVCMHVLEALQADHDLTLLTLSEPDVPALNRFFQTDVDPPTIELAGDAGVAVNRVAGHRLARVQAALLGRHARRRQDAFDLLVSTKNEFGLAPPAVQYVHSPQFVSADPGIEDEEPGPARRLYGGFCRTVAGVDRSTLAATTVLTNSDWTAEVVRRSYGVDAETVYPPVDASGFPDRPWDERDPGFVTIGRIGPSKNVLRNVEIVERLRERGHDVHLHVVGPTTDGRYAERVEERAADRAFVTLEGAVDRDRLVDLVAGHRYGLHGRPYEHFGIAVAELVAGGAVPFVPDSGGQREVVGDDERLLYGTPDEAVEKIDRVLSDPMLQRELRGELSGTVDRFDRERFEQTVRATVARELDREQSRENGRERRERVR